MWPLGGLVMAAFALLLLSPPAALAQYGGSWIVQDKHGNPINSNYYTGAYPLVGDLTGSLDLGGAYPDALNAYAWCFAPVPVNAYQFPWLYDYKSDGSYQTNPNAAVTGASSILASASASNYHNGNYGNDLYSFTLPNGSFEADNGSVITNVGGTL